MFYKICQMPSKCIGQTTTQFVESGT